MKKNEAGAAAEKLDSAELAGRLGRLQRLERVWKWTGLAGMLGGVIAFFAVRDAACRALLTALLFGGGLCCVLFLSDGAQKRRKALLEEQLGDFFRSELEKVFGPELHMPELQIDQPLLQALHLLEGRWEACRVERYRQGSHRGSCFAAANVQLIHVYEQGSGRGSLGTGRDTVFRGLILRCKTRACAPSGVFGAARTENSPDGILTGSEAFDRRFCVTAETERDARCLLTPQFTEWMNAFAQRIEGTAAAFCWEGDVFTLVLETDFGFASAADHVDMRDLDAVRRSYVNSLRETGEILDLLLENTNLFAEQDRERND